MILPSLTLVLMVGCICFSTATEIKRIEEQDVVLPCQHRFGHLVTKNLDIEWLLQDSDPNQKVVITYSSGYVYENVSAKQRGRISFAADYLMGDASIKISSLQATDSGLYTCKVKNAGEYDLKSAINLVVLDSRTPEMLLLRNLSHTNAGVYQCSATNEAGQQSCFVNITITYAKDPGIIAGAVIGVMLGLLLIFLIVWCTLYRKAKRKYEEEEQPNEIREDAEAPKAKLNSTQSSVGTGSTQSGSCSVKSIRNGTPYSQQPRTPSTKEDKGPVSYTTTEEVKTNKNGPTQAHMRRLGAVPVMIPAQSRAFQTV
ncbi:CXADR-like membrane protein isoform X2 [Leucoraja erinacea]|uniref:CXADR-like membrane protein isoform X2 n=1 Tax=Leucoraja erinaceus TaxID=7782 RepID=UPI00245840A0|nr:CXADR-like membrane protein isoform X2 [Leucoraja erinacea]